MAIAPGPTTAFAGYLIHTDLSDLSRSLTLGNFLGGLICWALGASLNFWLVAVIYNRLLGVRSTAPVTGPRPAVQGV